MEISSQSVLDLKGGNMYLRAVARANYIVCDFVVSAHRFLEAKRGVRRRIARGNVAVAFDSWWRICFHQGSGNVARWLRSRGSLTMWFEERETQAAESWRVR